MRRKGGARLLDWRNLVCGIIIVAAPSSLLAQRSDRGMLSNDGGTWLNESPAPAVTAIFPDSLVQTQAGHTARITMEGSEVLIRPETMFQFQGGELALDHGSLQVDTARGLKVLIGCITVDPVTSDRTQFDVTDVDGKVKVSALRHDAKIHLHGKAQGAKQGGGSTDTIVHEGQQLTRSEHCGGALLRPSEALDANGGWLDSLGAKIAGGAIIVGITCYALCRTNPGPVSPWQP
ncbi:MAG TPA: hypothetical protein VK722_19010 [Candidatus Aquilonibacter sp.]|nr:hypothetical protein [Candidatus Aquilonibacter sp.]